MKKEYMTVLVACVVALICLGTLIAMGEAQTEKLERLYHASEAQRQTAEKIGMTYLGVIDTNELFKRTEFGYDSEKVIHAIFRQNGLEAPDNAWLSYIGERDGLDLMKVTVYKEDPTKPLAKLEIEAEYLFGEV